MDKNSAFEENPRQILMITEVLKFISFSVKCKQTYRRYSSYKISTIVLSLCKGILMPYFVNVKCGLVDKTFI